MEYKNYFKLLSSNRLISDIWEYVLDLIKEEIKDKHNYNEYLIIFSILLSFVDDGNICISLNKDTLLNKFLDKLSGTKILLEEGEAKSKEELDKDFIDIEDTSKEVINNYLEEITKENLPSIIGEHKIFEIDDTYLYIKKYNDARLSIRKSIKRLFYNNSNKVSSFNYRDWLKKYELATAQEEIVKKGISHNLIITGGPGTGKTTSILFLLISLLIEDKDAVIHLAAPSGKASSRMKESIIKGLNDLEQDKKDAYKEVIDKINNLKESTIHSLLSISNVTHAFSYNKEHQFAPAIFVIDEASMIDICLFASLLDAIPEGSRIFIMGDKNQLPSVECGAVFAELLKMDELKDNIVTLNESKRFKEDSEIYDLASRINNGQNLNISSNSWLDYEKFEIKEVNKGSYPIYYYSNIKDGVHEKKIIERVVFKWGEKFYKDLQLKSMNLDPNDNESIIKLFKYSESSKILCAENESIRGVNRINELLKNTFIDKKLKTSVDNEYAGQIMMINKNNKELDLYNGDSGLLVTFKDDPTLYLMVRKASNLVSEDGKKMDKIFKLGDFVFYPFRMITRSEISLAYSITIHKSQGSDYPNILIILPSKKGHPLLNRQIVYTAITRTCGNTYLLTNIDRLNEAKDTVLVRDTNIA